MKGLQAAILGGSALILLVLALRLGFRKHLPRRLFPALWCAAAVRLLLPVSIPTRLSIWNLAGQPANPVSGGLGTQTLIPFPDLGQAAAAGAAPAASLKIHPLFILWLTVSVLLALYFCIGYLCMARSFRSSRIPPPACVDALLRLFRFRRSPRIRATNNRRAPLTFGVFRPVILLPEDLPDDCEAFRLILAHELAHVRRKDCLRKLLFAACLCLYWWDPLVWCMTALANRDMELACDEAVLRALGADCRKAYARTLLSMAARSPGPAPLCSGFARSSAESRIRAIAGFRPISKWAGLCAAIAFAILACAFSTQAALPAASKQQPAALEAAGPAPDAPLPDPAGAAEPDAPQSPPAKSAHAPAPEAAPKDAAPKYVWPLENENAAVNDFYGWREHPFSKKVSFHSGVDLDAPAESSVLAVADGTVLKAEYHAAYGYFIQLEHEDGVQTLYAHLQELMTAPGDEVKQGQIIALSGSSGWTTGPHLHLGVTKDGASVDPLVFLRSEE